MINRIIESAVKDRLIVLIGSLVIAIVGFFSYKNIYIDAIPDLSDIQVIVFTKFPGQSPQVVEDQVTYPLTSAMLSVPKTKVVRGYSFFGFSFVYIIFEDGTDMYWARTRVLEYLNYVKDRLPDGVSPTLGPDATGVGWVYEYALVDKTGKLDLSQLRTLQDWYLKYPLQAVKGVSEVASVGGYVKQYQIEVNPNALLNYNIPLNKVKQAINNSNKDVGGRIIEMGETEYMVRGLGYIKSINDINHIPVAANKDGIPIRIKDIANVSLGPELRRGATDLNGEGEVAGGIVVMRYGENAYTTIQAVCKKLEELKKGLPEGVEIIPVYDRGDLIERAIASLNRSLLEELIIVSLVIFLFLLHMRSSFVVIITLPLGILIAFIIMRLQGINANIMSLGGIAIAIGAMVDGAIVMVENAHRTIAQCRQEKGRGLNSKEHWKAIADSSKEVGPALFFSLLIITISFLPILTMQAQEGRLFGPLAFTKTYAMAASAILAITLVPVLMGYFIKGKVVSADKNPINKFLKKYHGFLLSYAFKNRIITTLLAVFLMVLTLFPYARLGSEFMPPLDEGDILYMPTTFPGISITKAKELMQQTDKILRSFPEVEQVFGKVGRAETATDPAPLSMLETTIKLKPKSQWNNPEKSTRDLMNEMDRAIQFPGLANSWTMPIKTRIDMLSTGIKTPVGIKVAGPDLNILQDLSERLEDIMNELPETLSAFGDRAVGGYYIDFDINRENAARYGLTTGDVQDVIKTAIGGMNITETVEGLERYPVNLRYPRDLRDNVDSLKRVLVPTPLGNNIPLSLVTDISYQRGPPVIKSENSRPNAWIYVDIVTSDVGGFVEKAKKVVDDKLNLPTGYTLSWSGQFEYMERVELRLRIIVPITLLIIFLLLYLHFRSILLPLIVMLSIPFSLIGGIWLIYMNGYNLSVAVSVGFIALAGMAAEIGVLVLSFINLEVKEYKNKIQRDLTTDEIKQIVMSGTSKRVRAVIMTVVSTMAGLLPIMLSTGTGADVTHRIAAPMMGGLITVLILNLLVLPVIYSFFIKK